MSAWRRQLWLAAALLPAAAPADARLLATYVLAAPATDVQPGGLMVRAVVDDGACPALRIDGRMAAMALRSAPRQFAPRPSQSGAASARPSAFPIAVCEARAPRRTRRLAIAGRTLPVMPRLVQRIIVIGDTGCRLKTADSAFQACNDPARWPFAAVARAAARLRPDLVLHVGDYHYRENACPPGNAGCAGSPWAYGWDAWDADFLVPAAPLLTAAPWVVVRGNHEECARAGQGWWLLLDPHPLAAGADCADAAQDFAANHTPPYAVALGGGARLIVADFAGIGERPLTDPAKLARYQADAAAIRALARAGDTNFVTDHYPFGAVTRDNKGDLRAGFASIADGFESAAMPPLPHVAAVISGHVHLLQWAAWAGRPAQLVTGFSGTEEDAPTAPARPAEVAQFPGGAHLADLVTRFNRFGYALLTRRRHGVWRVAAYSLDGTVLLRRTIHRR